MKSRSLIALLIVGQLALLSVTFAILLQYASEEEGYADYVNFSGKNRFHTAFILHELSEFEDGVIGETDLLHRYDELKNNLDLLRNGGVVDGDKINPLPEKFHDKLFLIETEFEKFHAVGLKLIDARNNGIDLGTSFFIEHEIIEVKLLDLTDELTTDVSDEFKAIIKQQETLEIILPVINGIIYIATILAIFKTLKKEGEKLQKLEKLYTIGQMASRLAHDLRNPLTVVKASVDFLLMKPDTDKLVKDRCTRIQKSVLDMNYIIEDVLEFAKTKDLNISSVSLLKLISESVQTLNVPDEVEIELPKNDVSFPCDGRKIQAIIVNLIVNSFDAMNDKGKITIKLEDESRSVKIQVIDSGPGIPDDIKSKIFEPLFTSKATGTGLGLGIGKNIVEQHGGTITVENNPTTFTITLPKK